MRSSHSLRLAGPLASAAIALAVATACASKPEPAPQTTQAVVVNGQPGDRAARAQAMQAMMFEGITLSSSQQTSIDSIRTAFRSRMGPPQQGADRAQMRQAMEEQRTAIRNVLTPDQQRIFDANIEKMRQERARGRGGRSS